MHKSKTHRRRLPYILAQTMLCLMLAGFILYAGWHLSSDVFVWFLFGLAAGVVFTLVDVLVETFRPVKPKKHPATTEEADECNTHTGHEETTDSE